MARSYVCTCNMCGKEFNVYDYNNGFGIHDFIVGYGSKYDWSTIDFDLCCDCMDKLFDMCKINPVTEGA